MSRCIGISSAPDARRRRTCWKTYIKFLPGISVDFRCSAIKTVRIRSLYVSFLINVSRRFGTKRVRANQVYQEYIADKHHLHMNSTRWVTLTEFIKHLGRTGVARVDETEKGWFIAWIDNSPKALAKAVRLSPIQISMAFHWATQEASMKKERATTSDEQRERTLIAEQIERAAAEAGPSRSETPPEDLGLKRDEGAEKVVLSLSAKAADAVKVSPPAPLKMNAFKSSTPNSLKPATNPLKRPNVFKSTTASSFSSTGTSVEKDAKKRALPMSAAERLIVEEQERKRRRMDKESLN